MMSLQEKITQCLQSALSTVEHLEVINESHLHNVPKNSETHFKIIIVSPHFDGLTLVKRHQSVYSALHLYIGNPIHALAIHAYTPMEWQEKTTSCESPPCRGGWSKEAHKVQK